MSGLEAIDAISVDQDVLEKDLAQKASLALKQKEDALDKKRLEKTRKKIDEINGNIAFMSDKIEDPETKLSVKEKYRDDIFKIQRTTLKQLRQDEKDIEDRLSDRKATQLHQSTGKRADETEHEFLVRTGRITPFQKTQTKEEDTEDEEVDLDNLKLKRRLSDSGDETETEQEDPKLDDGSIFIYKTRYAKWTAKRRHLRGNDEGLEEFLPHPTIKDTNFGGDFNVPGEVWSGLFPHQKTGVRWLYELYSQKAGGIVGDEMGLGKTVQIAAFLAALHHSRKLKAPALIVAPATVLHQWVSELHQWWPALRVTILHSIGTAMGELRAPLDDDDDEEDEEAVASHQLAKSIVQDMFETGHVVVTTYAGLKIYSKFLLSRTWSYCVLDEGHKIRNPNSDISLATKQVKTPHRIILSGTPIQNNLIELWSLFDFVFPGRLGTLPVFQAQFSVPINIGGYANATNVQVQTAYKCAVVLRDLISPYLLRRMKSDVATDLPTKSEKVLFCKLTKVQQAAYRQFLNSEEMSSIMKGKRQVLYGVDILRKICNHPDLVNRDIQKRKRDFGDPAKSGKMQVVKALLELWQTQGHKALLFTQSRQMLDLLEDFTEKLGIAYLRMDGTTAIAKRQRLVDQFNNNEVYKVFLLTTKVGGLGVNLTGANRVIIYDPDWNPSTDVQARERSWRLGQKREVMIYRLMIAGAIEEKIYHRQIFKQFLTNKILQDPKQKRFFKNTDLHDLFSLSDGSETDAIFGANESGKNEQVEADLAEVKGISREGDYKTTKEKTSDEDLLESLFAKANVQSTVEHDAIIESSRPDTVLMEREATRIANEAAEALKQSRKRARKSKIGTPTWTGRFGTAGKDPSKRSSNAILENLREKKQLETTVNVTVNTDVKPYKEKMEQIIKFLSSQPEHTAQSVQVVKHCKIKLDDDQAVANLRRMLQSVATWNKTSKSWTLRDDFETI